MQSPVLVIFTVVTWLAQVTCKATFKGVDFSSLVQQEAYGTKYYGLDGRQAPLEAILAENGVNAARLRVFVNAPRNKIQLQQTISLAKRAQFHGMKIYIDLFMSDVWADPLHQMPPMEWNVRSLADVLVNVNRYTRFVGDELARAGINVAMISIGNEINSGLLFPYGRTPNFDALSAILKAGSTGIRSSLSKNAKIVLHLANKGEERKIVGWLDAVLAQSVKGPRYLQLADFDVVGHSVYPYLAPMASFRNLQGIFNTVQNKFHKEQHIVETNWPVNCPAKWNAADFPPDMKGIWFDEKGQFEYFKRIGNMPLINGFWVWEPAWLARPGQGSVCPDVLMFDPRGHARSSVSVFRWI